LIFMKFFSLYSLAAVFLVRSCCTRCFISYCEQYRGLQ
jgi:hypothetical protein